MYILILVVMLLLLGMAVSAFGNTGSSQPSDATQTQDAKAVQPGDRIDIDYLCRIKTGEVVAASASVNEADSKSNIFLMRKESGSLSVIAVRSDELLPDRPGTTPFDEEIRERLTRVVAGMKAGETRKVELTARSTMPKEEQSGFAYVTRVRSRPKEMPMPKGDYEFRIGKTAEVGQSYYIDPAFPGKVEAITDKDVIIRFSAKPGDIIETPFGSGLIREEGDNYKVDIDAKEGRLVRTGNKIGRISHVDDKVITVDYRHPFGYETLTCDVTVGKIIKADPVDIGAGKQ